MNELIRRNNGTYYCPKDPGEPGGGQRISISESEGEILAELVAGKRVLEIGTGLGVSTMYLASTAESVYTVDVDEWVREIIWPDLLGEFENVVCIERPELAENVEIAFIDGRHEEQFVVADIEAALKAGCKTILLHDINSSGVKQAVASKFKSVERLATTYGIGIVYG